MTQIGVGIGGNKSPTKKTSIDKQDYSTRKIDSTTGDDFDDEDPQNLLGKGVINTQNSSNSSEQRRFGGGDDENSNSFESHSDFDLNHSYEKKPRSSNNSSDKTSRQKNRRGMSVNWGSNSSTAVHASSTSANRSNRGQRNQKHGSNVKFFATTMAHSLYRNPMRLSGLSSTLKTKGASASQNKNSPQTPTAHSQLTTTSATIPAESDLQIHRIHPPPPPQPRPESLAIMSEELFHERLKARQSPLLPTLAHKPPASLTVNTQLSTDFPSTSSFLLDKHCIEDVTYSTTNQVASENSEKTVLKQKTPPSSPQDRQKPLADLNPLSKEPNEQHEQLEEVEPQKICSPIKTMINCSVDSSDESWRLLNSNSSLDEHIPYIDETDFEDLGRRKNPTTQFLFLKNDFPN